MQPTGRGRIAGCGELRGLILLLRGEMDAIASFRHLILTRFNVRIPEYPDAGGPNWLQHRFDIFERFCLPCVRGQSNLNFDWLLFCSPDMPGILRERLLKYSEWPNIRPVCIEGDFTQAAVKSAVREYTLGVTHLITTRLDNDDGICRSFVETIQNRFSGQDFEFLNFTNGYIWVNGVVYAGQHSTNPFISLIERAENPSTVYSGNHMRLRELGPIRQIERPAGWLQVVHTRNLANEAWGRPAAIQDLYDHFAIVPESLTGVVTKKVL